MTSRTGKPRRHEPPRGWSPTPPTAGLTLIEVLTSIVLLAVSAVFIMQALARISYAQLVAEDRRSAYFFSLSKVAEVELAVRQGTFPQDGEHGRIHVGASTCSWEVTASRVADDPQEMAVVLTTSWHRGAEDVTHHVETILHTLHGAAEP